MDLSSLASSLQQSTKLTKAEKDLMEKFRAAALSITTLYKSSLHTSKRAYSAGYSACLTDVLQMINRGVSSQPLSPLHSSSSSSHPSSASSLHRGQHLSFEGQERMMTIGRILDWIEARQETLRQEEDDEDMTNEEGGAAGDSSAPSPAVSRAREGDRHGHVASGDRMGSSFRSRQPSNRASSGPPVPPVAAAGGMRPVRFEQPIASTSSSPRATPPVDQERTSSGATFPPRLAASSFPPSPAATTTPSFSASQRQQPLQPSSHPFSRLASPLHLPSFNNASSSTSSTSGTSSHSGSASPRTTHTPLGPLTPSESITPTPHNAIPSSSSAPVADAPFDLTPNRISAESQSSIPTSSVPQSNPSHQSTSFDFSVPFDHDNPFHQPSSKPNTDAPPPGSVISTEPVLPAGSKRRFEHLASSPASSTLNSIPSTESPASSHPSTPNSSFASSFASSIQSSSTPHAHHLHPPRLTNSATGNGSGVGAEDSSFSSSTTSATPSTVALGGRKKGRKSGRSSAGGVGLISAVHRESKDALMMKGVEDIPEEGREKKKKRSAG